MYRIYNCGKAPSILTAYYEKYPKVDLILETNTTEQLIKLVFERKLDGAFIAGSTQHAELHTTVFHEEELVLISKNLCPLLQT